MLWLAIHLPALPLEALAPVGPETGPLAVCARSGRGEEIIGCNGLARAAGITKGMKAAAARALLSELRVLERVPEREQRMLEGVALWAGRFTSSIVLSPPNGVILEIGGSLRLFEGITPLLKQLRLGLDTLGHRGVCCVAPTPGGALCLAAAGRALILRDQQALQEALGDLQLSEFPLPAGKRAMLYGMGLRRVADLLALPRAGLSRRVGREAVEQMGRLFGDQPDPRPFFQPPECFLRRLELPAEVAGSTALLFAAKRLLMELSGFLTARQAGTQRLEWALFHGAGAPTRFVLGLLSPAREVSSFLELLRQRLERVTLGAPVRAITLRVDELHPLEGRPMGLFAGDKQGEARSDRLLERLQARLGRRAVQGLRRVADHRPERAWSFCAPGSEPGDGGPGFRPVWLLETPLRLETRDGRPCWNGRLRLEPERERLETGWWDGGDIARDYFIAHAEGGLRLWVYREIGGRRHWYLHGLF